MKILKAVTIVVLMTLPLFSANAQAAEVCRLLESDIDGDGWGWEAGASCRITAETGTTPQMNHPRTGEAINFERIYWVWEDFSNKTFDECQGYIVDPAQARDICSTCVDAVASLFHGSGGAGTYTRLDSKSKANKARAYSSLAAAARMTEVVGVTLLAGAAVDSAVDCTDQDNGVVSAECPVDADNGTNAVAGLVMGDTGTSGGVGTGGIVTFDAGGTVGVDTVGTATVGMGSTTTVDNVSTTTVNAGGTTTVDAGGAATVDADGTTTVDTGGAAAGTGAASLRATFAWNVDNLGLYSGALAIEFFGERTAAGVRYWEATAPGQTGFYTLCELLPSSMGRLTAAPSDNAVNEDAAACVDTDGDGWGWDGSATCIP